MNARPIWYQIDIELAGIEENGWRLFELGACGVEEIEVNKAKAFFKGDEVDFSRFQAEVRQEGFTILSATEVVDDNWVAKCEEVLVPVNIGRFVIEPVLGVSNRSGKDVVPIFLPPGIGFGTGHHPTTQSMLSMMQLPFFSSALPKRILDLGTGSGILSIAAALLFPEASIEAIDTDGEAIIAATDNSSMNGVVDRIVFKNCELKELPKTYDLIMANIYAEILIDLENKIRGNAVPGCSLMLAGILESSIDQVKKAYSARYWDAIHEETTGEWAALLMRRKNVF